MTSDKENSSKILILEEMADSKIHIALNVGHQFFSWGRLVMLTEVDPKDADLTSSRVRLLSSSSFDC